MTWNESVSIYKVFRTSTDLSLPSGYKFHKIRIGNQHKTSSQLHSWYQILIYFILVYSVQAILNYTVVNQLCDMKNKKGEEANEICNITNKANISNINTIIGESYYSAYLYKNINGGDYTNR